MLPVSPVRLTGFYCHLPYSYYLTVNDKIPSEYLNNILLISTRGNIYAVQESANGFRLPSSIRVVLVATFFLMP